MRKLYVSICEAEGEILGQNVNLVKKDSGIELVFVGKTDSLDERIAAKRLVTEARDMLDNWLTQSKEADYDEPERP